MPVATIYVTSDGKYFAQQEDADNYILANPGVVYWEVYYNDAGSPIPYGYPILDPSGQLKILEVDTEGNVGTDAEPPTPFGTGYMATQVTHTPPLQTTNAWVRVAALTLPATFKLGTYRLGFTVTVRLNSTWRDIDISVRRNGTTFIFPTDVGRAREEMKDTGSDQRVVRTGVIYSSTLQPNDLLELVCRGTRGATARIYSGTLELWRVS